MTQQATSHAYITPTLETTSATVYSEEYYASSINGTTQAGGRAVSMTRTGVGQWDVVLGTAHPDDLEYHVSFTAEEQGVNRDTPDITIVQGSKTATSFMVQITTGDNGGVADVHIDTPFTLAIDAPVNVLNSATLGSGSALTPANGVLISYNFQDGNGNAPFNLQVAATGGASTWKALVRNVPYASIPSLVNDGRYTLQTTDNGDGTYSHLFTGQDALSSGENYIITGGTPAPAGAGTTTGNPELYL